MPKYMYSGKTVRDGNAAEIGFRRWLATNIYRESAIECLPFNMPTS